MELGEALRLGFWGRDDKRERERDMREHVHEYELAGCVPVLSAPRQAKTRLGLTIQVNTGKYR